MALFVGTTTTEGAQTNVLLVQQMTPESSAYVDLVVLGIDTQSNSAQFDRVMRVKRTATADPVIFDNPRNNEYRESGASGWLYTVTVVPTGFEIRATGVAGKTINWYAELNVTAVVVV